jgi:hypothetical protein
MPKGAAIGLVSGGAVGAVLWWVVPGFQMPDAIGAALAGLTLGSLTQWLLSAANAQRTESNGPQLIVPLTIRF